MVVSSVPQALVALQATELLATQTGDSTARQAHRVAERLANWIPRPEVLAALEHAIRTAGHGLILLEAPPGSGATTLLCHMAVTRPYPFWLPQEDAAGLAGLCAQVIALYRLPLALLSPLAARDATVLERLLVEAGAARPADDPAVLLIGRLPDAASFPLAFPAVIPPGAVVVLACAPGAQPPNGLLPAARVALPQDDADSLGQLVSYAQTLGCPPKLAAAVAERAAGSFLFVRLALGVLAAGVRRRTLPAGLAALHRLWWRALEEDERRLITALAAAGELCGLELAGLVAGVAPDAALRCAERWRAFLERDGALVSIYHPVTLAFVMAQRGEAVGRVHAAYAQVGSELLVRGIGSGGVQAREEGYFVRQLARHIMLRDTDSDDTLRSLVTGRDWIRAQARRTGDHRAAASDLECELSDAAQRGPVLRLIRSAALAATLGLLARAVPLDAPATAFAAALEQGQPREPMLRHVRAIVDQLPDGRDKAQVMRRLGEVCFALRMRASAMRLLSEALDLEAPGLPRVWRDEREEALVAFARAATVIGAPDVALGITTRIVHPERRGMIETAIVRWLLARGQLTRAEEVAYAIGHPGTHEWAMAEVAVGHARVGDYERAGVVLSTLRTETAVAWVSVEIACDAARSGNPRAVDRVALLPNVGLRDRGLVQVTRAMVAGGMGAAALDVVRMVLDDELRARGLVELALAYPPLAAEALDEASQSVAGVSGDEQAPVVAALAAAQAAVGRPDDALRTASILPEGEGRDRAHSRIAVALGRTAEWAVAETVAGQIADDDERDWALDELARLRGAAGAWDEGFALAARISVPEQRAHTEADLAIGLARSSAPAAAHTHAQQISVGTERMRAETAIAPALVAAGEHDRIAATMATLSDPDARARYAAVVVAALAHHRRGEAAVAAAQIVRPVQRARALTALADAAAQAGAIAEAQHFFGMALVAIAPLGRRETFACLGLSAGLLAALGGAELLLTAAGVLDEIDSWWS
jgi:hypothetical protein